MMCVNVYKMLQGFYGRELELSHFFLPCLLFLLLHIGNVSELLSHLMFRGIMNLITIEKRIYLLMVTE